MCSSRLLRQYLRGLVVCGMWRYVAWWKCIDISYSFAASMIKTVTSKGRFTHSMPFPFRAYAVPLPCRAAKGLECVFPHLIYTVRPCLIHTFHAMPCSDHAVLLKATAQHGRLSTAVLCRGLEKNGMFGAWNGMASVNQTRPHCVNQMGKTHSKHLAARHGSGTAWARHGNGMLCVNRP